MFRNFSLKHFNILRYVEKLKRMLWAMPRDEPFFQVINLDRMGKMTP